jgi:hypothetical protein
VAAFLDDLQSLPSVVAVELRPPRAELESGAGMDAWIDLHHSVRALARQDIRVMLTDSAVGAQEENNLRHLVANLGDTVPRTRIVPFLTTKHSLEYCLSYADQAVEHGFPALVILGGDKHIGRPRIVEHAWQLRALLRARHPQLQLGGWANPVANPIAQVRFLVDPDETADFYLTQIVSHHQQAEVDAFLNEAARTGLSMPGVFGVFYYRSANARTLQTLSQFLPVPVDALTREFAGGATPAAICARTIRALRQAGARHVYISNLPQRGTLRVLQSILDQI